MASYLNLAANQLHIHTNCRPFCLTKINKTLNFSYVRFIPTSFLTSTNYSCQAAEIAVGKFHLREPPSLFAGAFAASG